MTLIQLAWTCVLGVAEVPVEIRIRTPSLQKDRRRKCRPVHRGFRDLSLFQLRVRLRAPLVARTLLPGVAPPEPLRLPERTPEREPRRSLQPKRITQAERRSWEALEPGWDADRPKTRGDCLPGGCNASRPCPFASCKFHLYLDVNPENGSIKRNFPGLDMDALAESCALDVAEREEERIGDDNDAKMLPFELVGAYLGLSLESARQIVGNALDQLRRAEKRRARFESE